jgi:chemotaxis protein MotB
MRGIDDPRAWLTPLLGIFFCACGVSRGDWEQKVRENEEVTRQLTTEQSARQKAEADYADTLDEVDAMKAQLSERGLSIEAMAASLEAQNKALVEYQARTAQLLEMQARFDALRAKLKKLSEIGLSVVVRNNRMVVELPGDLLFDSGSDRLSDEGKAIVLQVAEAIRSDVDLAARQFQVAGHTDGFALSGGFFRDNWGLSAMRARSVLTLLTAPTAEAGGGLDPTHYSLAGYGSTDPVASNDTAAGRSKNRRVELVVQPNVEEMISLDSLASSQPSPPAKVNADKTTKTKPASGGE